ncbi:MAG: hypothetical protein Athens101428_408 [Candidatus Berkelbacteria bacterium Athens1014_28]|uniref:Uncharacterized protein n=1 Tax=Candidatus Berkelbacteria bacterium Athens1014_28 TaxID=2017145 RepID=A0A554LMV5_9BACT|nr:MAG: hypothetical protein Athens101428_408 [Candidatus Berkelbacteria bacterium Athens1014_28]
MKHINLEFDCQRKVSKEVFRFFYYSLYFLKFFMYNKMQWADIEVWLI